MSTTSTPAGPGGSGGPTVPPICTRRTHTSAAVSAALKNLPKASKRSKNVDIEGRNAERVLKHAQHVSDVSAFPDDASDAESLISVSDDEDTLSPASHLYNSMSKMSPGSAKAVLHLMQANKHPRDADDAKTEKPAQKKACTEITIAPGMSLPIVFHSCIRELYKYDIYMPLSMFTTPNLLAINTNATTMHMAKLNPPNTGDKQIRVIDTDVFEQKIQAELSLDRAQWTEAARNYVNFISLVEGAGSSAEARWNAHFAFFQNSPDAADIFPAILIADHL
ncbi:hypothetical protein DFH07DRAFT_774542 [Mycena maculata]|uniref:Uncharacterized protein n=1 Tax=Mycena maculata TaxID=230809 RepID=A0AAD7IX31_9AGAR|nr:hypothetical protein DFH07DRAFT_774542 [Mycena maculata]